MSWLTRSLVLGGAGSVALTNAEFAALVAAGGLQLGIIYRVGTPEVWYRATGANTYQSISSGGLAVNPIDGYLVDEAGGVVALIETTPILATLTASGVGKNSPTEFSGLDVTAINGQTTATIYDNASTASGTILAVFVLTTVGHYPVDSAWIRPLGGKGIVSAVNGIYVSFAGGTSRTVNVLG